MKRFIFGVLVWLCGAILLLYVALLVIDRLGDGRRLIGIVFEDNWRFTVPGLAFVAISYHIMSRVRF